MFIIYVNIYFYFVYLFGSRDWDGYLIFSFNNKFLDVIKFILKIQLDFGKLMKLNECFKYIDI